MSQRLGAWVLTDINKFKKGTLFDCCKARLSDMEYRDTVALTLLKEHDTAHYTSAQIVRTNVLVAPRLQREYRCKKDAGKKT